MLTKKFRVSDHSRVSNWAFQPSSNQRAPNELDIAVMKAPPSPQPALPRRQMPLMSLSRSVISRAAFAMKFHDGAAGISSPAFAIRSVRYMIIELSP